MNLIARALYVPVDDVSQHRIEVGAHELEVIRILQERAHRFKEPECRIDRVVFRSLTGIRKTIGQHSLIDVRGKLSQDALGNFCVTRRESQTTQGDHCVTTPIREPMIASNYGLAAFARDDELIGGGSKTAD